MAYITLTDLLNDLPERELVQLTNDEDRLPKDEENADGYDLTESTDVIVQRVTAAIADASEEIDSMLRKRYTVPVSPVPERVKKICKTIAKYYLFSRRMVDIPEGLEKQYQNAREELKDIMSGEIVLEVAMSSVRQTNKTSEDRVFSKEVLDCY